MVVEYIHTKLKDDIITSISGHYTFDDERHLYYEDRDVLYLTASAVIDSSCCGAGGCLFALVIGFVLNWHIKKDKNNLPVSIVDTISDQIVRNNISNAIIIEANVSQVNFWAPLQIL